LDVVTITENSSSPTAQSKPASLPSHSKNWITSDWIVAVFLFAATAAVVVWQNSRLTVLYDLCGVLENSFRISLGDIPYRDFPFPYAPLTFVVQAALIKLTGPVIWHHIAYCAVIGGASTVLALLVIQNLLRGVVSAYRVVSFLLATPMVILGVYCIFPHPFYDPDCAFVVLTCILLWQRLERKGYPVGQSIVVGGLLVLPLFIKQNIGLAFLGTTIPGLLLLIGIGVWRRESVRGYVWLIAGIISGLGIALTIIHFTAGLANYKYWTISYAALRRAPSRADMLSIYRDWVLLLWVALFGLGAVLLRLNKSGKLFLSLLSVALMTAPFAWSVIYLLRDSDASERAERLVGVWPFMLLVSGVMAVLAARRRKGLKLVLPFTLIATAHGVFLSQQLWGSTYGVWPLLAILVADLLTALVVLAPSQHSWAVRSWAAVVSVSLLISGGFYVYANERLDYVNLSDGDMQHSTLPQLKGLSLRGSFLPDFEELVQYTSKAIPRDDGILFLPGEDLFYYTTGRKPRFPVLLFDITNNPLSPEEILAAARAHNIRWLIVKNDLQIEVDKTIDDKDHQVKVLRQDFKLVESLNNYEIYRRKGPNEVDEDQDDKDDQDDSEPPTK
jgi:hypothetical protein